MSQWATHQRLLVKAVLNTGGAIVELGCGWYSTPILHEIAKSQRRPLYTFDTSREWLDQFTHLSMKYANHHLYEVATWSMLEARVCGVVFIDMAPGAEREYAADAFREKADVLVLHDTENQVEYGWPRVLPTFPYQYTDKTQPTWTTLVSMKIDVREWFK